MFTSAREQPQRCNSCARACRCVSDCPRAGRCVATRPVRGSGTARIYVPHGPRFMPLAAKRASSRLSAADPFHACGSNERAPLLRLDTISRSIVSTYRERDRRSFTPVDRRHLLDRQHVLFYKFFVYESHKA